MSNEEENEESYLELPGSGSKFQFGSVLAHPDGLEFTVRGTMPMEDDLMILLEPLVPDTDDPGSPQGEVLTAMNEWTVVDFEPAAPSES